jgi:hypothetical protein
MTLSNRQALAGAHIPALGPLRETVKLPPNASTLRAIRRASITGTFVTAKSGDKAAPWFRLASGGAPSRRLRTPPMVIVLITPSAVVTTHRAEQHELRGQGDVDHVRKVRVGPRTHIQLSDLRLSAFRYGIGEQYSARPVEGALASNGLIWTG